MFSTPKARGGLFLASSLCDGLEDNNIRQVATLLLNKNADPNILIPMHGVSPFHLVIGNDSAEFAEEVTKLFLRHGGDPNVKSNDGMTPVHIAAAWGRINILELLLANGGDPLCLDNDGRSPFHYAFDGKYFNAVTILAKYCEDVQDDDDELKYKMMLDKILVTNGDIIAEYVALPGGEDSNSNNALNNNIPCDVCNCKPNVSSKNLALNNISTLCNVSRVKTESGNDIDTESDEVVNLKSANLFTTDDQIIVKQDSSSQTNSKDVLNYSFIDLDFDFANLHLSNVIQKEKCLVSKIINHLSMTLTSDCTSNEKTLNEKTKQENCNVTNNSDMSPSLKEKVRPSYEHEHCKASKNFSPKFKHNHNKDILKPSSSTKKKQFFKFNTESRSREKHLNNSIVNMSPNFNTPNYKKRANATKSSLILPHIYNDDIISRSPNFLTPYCAGRKKNMENMSFVNNCLSSKLFLKPQKNRRHITQSTPRKKKRSIYKFHSGRKRVDCYRQKDSVTTSLKPINLGKTIFSEVSEDETRHDSMNSNFRPLLLNYDETSKIGCKTYFNCAPINLHKDRYDEDDKIHDNSDSSQMGLDNSFKQTKKKNEYVNNSDNNQGDDLSCKNEQNDKFVTIRRNAFKIEGASGTINSVSYNIGSKNSSTLSSENYVNCIECNTKKLLNEDICINISKTCNLHAKNCCIDRFHKRFPRQLEAEEDSRLFTVNLSEKYGKHIYLPNALTSYSSILNDSKCTEDKTGDSNVHKIEKNSSLSSYVTTQEEYKYEDLEEGVVLLERRLCTSPFVTLSGSECDAKHRTATSVASSMSTVASLPKELLLIDDIALRRELTQLGDQPGPITNTTRYIYQKRLMYLQSIRGTTAALLPKLSTTQNLRNYTQQHHQISKMYLEFGDWVNHLDIYRSMEKQVFEEFVSPNPSRRWREGMSQTSFNYLLLDPRVTQDLQHRRIYLKESEVWSIFLNAIFYIGKGKRSRPFAHLYDAFKVWVSKTSDGTNKKISRILDIWNSDHGVICLHIFQNVIPVEAYTREAAMIDAIGPEYLGNCKRGEYYGIVATWNNQQKQKFGRYLLYNALQIFLHEGEHQLFPQSLN